MSEPVPRFSLTPAEWLLIFPRAPPTTGSHFTDSLSVAEEGKSNNALSDVDPASELREQFPFNRTALDSTLTALDARGLAFQFRIADVLLPAAVLWSPGPALSSTVWNLCNFALVGTIWILNNDNLFESKQLIAGTIAVGVSFLSIWCSQVISSCAARRGSRTTQDCESASIAPVELLVRWHQLLCGELNTFENSKSGAKEKDTSSSLLLKHEPNDNLCPCSECLRTLPQDIFWDRARRPTALHVYAMFAGFALGWTPMVQFGSLFWSQPWGIFLGVVFATSIVVYSGNAIIDKWLHPSVPLVRLKGQIYHRASSLALRAFLEKAKADLRCPSSHEQTSDPKDPSDPELFIRLHAGYMARWQESHLEASDLFVFFMVMLMPAAFVVSCIINLVSKHLVLSGIPVGRRCPNNQGYFLYHQAAGSCMTLWSVAWLLMTVAYSAFSLTTLPIANGQITAITSLYGDAQRALDMLLAQASCLPQTPERRDVMTKLSAHSSLLQTFREADRLRAKFLGIPVTWGVVKTFFVTLFTLGVGLWSVLRGVGVFFTLQTVCPVR